MSEANHEVSGQSTAPSALLVHQWVIAAVVSAGARFIPVPWADELVRERCRRFAISSTLASHNVPLSPDELRSYYSDRARGVSGCAGTLPRALLKLLLFPIRKIVAVATSVRQVPLEIIRVVLLARTLDRCLREGRFPTQGRETAATVLRMRSAFDRAFARMDFRVVRAALRDALAGVNGWRTAAIASGRRLARRRGAGTEDLVAEPEINAGASRIQEVLARSKTLELFAEFDRRFDEAFAEAGSV